MKTAQIIQASAQIADTIDTLTRAMARPDTRVITGACTCPTCTKGGKR
ncbi:hypothetical protein [Streptosporangium sp. V21-05]